MLEASRTGEVEDSEVGKRDFEAATSSSITMGDRCADISLNRK